MARFGFAAGSYQLRNVNADCQLCQNFYPEAVESGTGASAIELSPTWGLAHFADLGGPSVRGSLFHDGRLFVAADQFYEVFSDGTQVAHGFLPSLDPTGSEPVTMVANNANQLLICAAGELWLFPLASGSIIYTGEAVSISQVIISDPGGANLDYYFTPTAAVPAWTTGTSLTLTGLTNLPFLNFQNAPFLGLDGSGNIHVQLPRTLSQAFPAPISAINVVSAGSTSGSSQKSPTSANQIASGSHVSWLNPTGIIGTSSPAQAPIPNQSAQTYVDVLVGANCGFAIPSAAVIDGIAVSFQLQTDATNFINGNVGVQLQKAGTATGNLPNETIPYSSSFQTINFGSPTDLWGVSWSPSDINNAGFGLGVHVAGQYQGSAVNLVTNGDFENGLGPATGWTTMRNSNTQWGFSGQYYTGARSYGVIPISTSGAAPAIQFDTTVPVTAGDVLLLSGAILNTSLATQGSILCQFYNGSTFVSQQGISNTTTTVANFVFQQAIITVPTGANQMQVVLANNNSTASCYYDDVQIVHVHVANLQNYQITVYYHDVTYNATVTFTAPVSPFQLVGQPLTFSGLTNVPQLNGNTYALTSWSGNTATVDNVAATGTYSGTETGNVTGDISSYTGTDTGSVTGNVISYNTDPVQVATEFGPFSWVGFLDGYFLGLLTQDAQTTQGKTMQYSALEDGTTWADPTTGLDWNFTVLPFTDSVVGAIVNQRNLWLYGPKQTIVYYDSGDPFNQFAPISGAFLEYGLAAEWSLAKLDQSVFWVGADERGWAMAFRSNGWSEQRVSNHAIEQEWNDYADISDAQAYSIQTDGHQFYHIWFPTANKSWRYDAATGMWHEPCWWNGSDNVAHRSRNHVFAFNKHLLGDPNSGTLYFTDQTLVTDDVVLAPPGGPIRRVRRAPHVSNEMEWEFHHRLRISMETGLGPVNEIATVATGPPYLFAQDANGNNWQVQINDNGTTTASSQGAGTAPAPMLFVDLVGLPYNITVYTLGVDTSGNLTLTPAPGIYTGYYTRLAMMTLPSALQTYISVQNGAILIDPPIAATREPQVMLKWSDDGGHTWSNEYAVGAGMAGNFRRRVEWRRLGRSRDRVYEMAVTDPIPWRVVDAYLFTSPSNQQPMQRYAQQLAKMA